jgi:hypothetical protein
VVHALGSLETARYSGVLERHICLMEGRQASNFKKNLLWDGFQKVAHSLGYHQRNRDLKIRSRQSGGTWTFFELET